MLRNLASSFAPCKTAEDQATTLRRDIKSSNVLLTAEGRAKIADVGLAKVATAYFSSANTIGTFRWVIFGKQCLTRRVNIEEARCCKACC